MLWRAHRAEILLTEDHQKVKKTDELEDMGTRMAELKQQLLEDAPQEAPR